MRRALVAGTAGALVVAAALGCAAPFDEVKPSAPHAGVALVYCGSAATSPESVMKAMEPPTGPTGESSLPDDKELRVCLRLENRGQEPARLTRSDLGLKTPHESTSPSADHDDDLVIALPGETRELHASFRYSPLVHGEEVQLLLANAVTVGGHAVKLPPIVLRKR
ncbi:MAG TPA: hypothetical protein VF945_05000 [Polyangia bacterium]